MLTLDSSNIKSAIVYAFLMGIFSMAIYVVGVGDIWAIDAHVLINSGVLAFVTGIISLVKNLLTDNSGKFAGIIKVIPDNVDTTKE